MGVTTRREIADARALALEAASYISSDRTLPGVVLANMNPIEAFLLGGDTGDSGDLFARCRAVRRHMTNLRYTGTGDNDAAGFVTAAWKYYDRLAPGWHEAADQQGETS